MNVLAVWPVDVYKTALFAVERLGRGVARRGHGDETLPRAVRKIAKRNYSFVMSVCLSASNNSTANGLIFVKLDLRALFEFL